MSFLNELKLSLESQSALLKENEYSNLSMETLCNDIRYLAYSEPSIEYFGISTEGIKEFAKKTVEVVRKMLKWIREKIGKILSIVFGVFNSKERKKKQEKIKENHTNETFKKAMEELKRFLPEIDKHEEFDKNIFRNLEDYGKEIPYKKMMDFLDVLVSHLNSYIDMADKSLDISKYKDFDSLVDYVNSIQIEASVRKGMLERSSKDGIALAEVFKSKLLNLAVRDGVKLNPKNNIENISDKTHHFIGGNVYYGTNDSIWPEYSKYKGKETINSDFLKTVEFYREATILATSSNGPFKEFLNDLKGYEKWFNNKMKVCEERLKIFENEPENPYSNFKAMITSDIVTKCERILLTITKITSDFVNYDRHLINYVSSVDLIVSKLAKSMSDEDMGYNK